MLKNLANQQNKILTTLHLRKLNESDIPKINKHIAKYYSYEVPDRLMFKLTPKDIGNLDYERVKKKMKCNCSFGFFVKATEELVALHLNTIHERHSTNNPPTDGEMTSDNKGLAAFLRFSLFVEGDIFKDLNASKFMVLSMACCMPQYRDIRLNASLIEAGEKLATSRGCDYIVSHAVSRFSQRILLRAGYKVLREVQYAKYVDPLTGKKPGLILSAVHPSTMLLYKNILSNDGRSHL